MSCSGITKETTNNTIVSDRSAPDHVRDLAPILKANTASMTEVVGAIRELKETYII